MIGSILVADAGMVAARVMRGFEALGIKTVAADVAPAVGVAGDVQRPSTIGCSARLADDVVLLSDLDELRDAHAVLAAGTAAGVAGIHPGRGPLRADPDFTRLARNAGFLPVVSDIGPGAAAPARSGAEVDVCLLAHATGCVLLGTLGPVDEGWMSPAPADTERARRLARAAVAQGELSGLMSVVVLGDVVVGIDAGLPVGQAALEQVSGLDLVQLQLAHALGDPIALPVEVPAAGVALSRGRLDVVSDERTLDDIDRVGLRLELTPRHPHGRETIVWATGYGADAAQARSALDRYTRAVSYSDAPRA